MEILLKLVTVYVGLTIFVTVVGLAVMVPFLIKFWKEWKKF